MIKRKVFIVYTLLILLITGCIIESVLINVYLDNFITTLENIDVTDKNSLQDLHSTKNYWEKKCNILKISLTHYKLGEITISLAELIGAVKAEDYKSALALQERTLQLAKELEENGIFSFANLV